MKKANHFELHELICPHVLNRDGELGWRYFRPVMIDFIDWLRDKLGRPVYVNNYGWGGQKSQRGLRCNMCSLVKNKKTLYMSAHVLGCGIDFNVKGMTPDEVRGWIAKNIPAFFALHPEYTRKCRIERAEDAPSWVHIDFFEHDEGRIVQKIKA